MLSLSLSFEGCMCRLGHPGQSFRPGETPQGCNSDSVVPCVCVCVSCQTIQVAAHPMDDCMKLLFLWNLVFRRYSTCTVEFSEAGIPPPPITAESAVPVPLAPPPRNNNYDDGFASGFNNNNNYNNNSNINNYAHATPATSSNYYPAATNAQAVNNYHYSSSQQQQQQSYTNYATS